MTISEKEYLKGHDKDYPLSPEQFDNMLKLLAAVNELRAIWNKPMVVTSGYRPVAYNKAIGGAPQSKHCQCLAIDIRDTDDVLDNFLTDHPELLEKFDLSREHPDSTPGWVHLALGVPPSGKRTFFPNRK